MLPKNSQSTSTYPSSDTPLLPEVGALNLWRTEVSRGLRKKTDIDALWEAACAEMNARDYIRDGMPNAANDERRKAAAIIVTLTAESAA